MKTGTRNTIVSIIVLMAVLVGWRFSTAGNSGSPSSLLTQQQATEIVTNHLDGYNARDYDAFSRDFHPSLREGVTAEAFHAFHDDAMTKIGRYLSISSVELDWGVMSGVVVWTAIADFEHEADVEVRLAFKPDGTQIEGTRFLAEALGA